MSEEFDKLRSGTCQCHPHRFGANPQCPVHGNTARLVRDRAILAERKPLTSITFDAKIGIKDGVNVVEDIKNVKLEVNADQVSNVVNFDTALRGVTLQYYEGAITYAEMLSWIIDNLPPPCDNPEEDAVYGPLIYGIRFANKHEDK